MRLYCPYGFVVDQAPVHPRCACFTSQRVLNTTLVLKLRSDENEKANPKLSGASRQDMGGTQE